MRTFLIIVTLLLVYKTYSQTAEEKKYFGRYYKFQSTEDLEIMVFKDHTFEMTYIDCTEWETKKGSWTSRHDTLTFYSFIIDKKAPDIKIPSDTLIFVYKSKTLIPIKAEGFFDHFILPKTFKK